jgi:CRP/FNR family cyclic AMP-dependent transcriptional regulator
MREIQGSRLPSSAEAKSGEAGIAMVRVLDEDSALGRLHPRSRDAARTAAIAPLLTLPPGVTRFLIDEAETHGHFGLLVLDGMVARHVTFGQISSTEFVGPGDAIRPWVVPDGGETFNVRWEILSPTRLAVLDREFASRVRPWPEIAADLLDRSTARIHSQLLQAALRQAKRVDDRVLLALWHFAARWGTVGSEGRIVRIPNITGEVLARIVGARRQSVSTALNALQARGAIQRRPDGGWVIPDRPSQLEQLEVGSRASDSVAGALHPSPGGREIPLVRPTRQTA